MSTANDILTAAFVKVGIESPTTAQTATGLISLNNMITMWGAEGLLYSWVSESFTVTTTALYTYGSGGTWDSARPLDILQMYLKDSDGYDHYVRRMSSREYNAITNKTFSARPKKFYFVPEYSLAKVIFDSEPDTTYTAYVEAKKNFTTFATVGSTANMPAECIEPLIYNLTVAMAEDWRRDVNETVYANAARTKENLAQLFATQKLPAKAKFESFRAGYNITTDEYV